MRMAKLTFTFMVVVWSWVVDGCVDDVVYVPDLETIAEDCSTALQYIL